MDLVRKVEVAIRRQGLLAPGMRVAVACSGGADSVALLRLLEELKSRLGLRLLVVHLNHQLRGAAADRDEAFVRELAERLELEFLVRREDVAARARKHKANLEEAGRQARLEFFASLVTNGRADAVALGHTMDDQAETVLARLLRGAGTKGLAGIFPVVELPPAKALAKAGGAGAQAGRLVRPLLGVRRQELRAYLGRLGQSWREDVSNLDPKRLRNQIRRELLPRLTRWVGPAVVEHLAQLAAQAREEEGLWAALVEEQFRTQGKRVGDQVELSVAPLLEPASPLTSLPPCPAREAQRALARRVLRRALGAVRGDLRRLTHRHVESVLRLAEQGQSGQRVVLPGVEVERQFNQLVFRPAGGGAVTGDFEIQVEAPGSVRLPSGRALRFKLVAVGGGERGYNNLKSVLDAAQAPFPLLVRNWRPGDTYQPVGATRRRKLKTLFQQQRVPVAERASTPVVLCGGEIVWVRRFGIAAPCRLSRQSRTGLLIEERAAK